MPSWLWAVSPIPSGIPHSDGREERKTDRLATREGKPQRAAPAQVGRGGERSASLLLEPASHQEEQEEQDQQQEEELADEDAAAQRQDQDDDEQEEQQFEFLSSKSFRVTRRDNG
jgi:hypothetical protein